MKIDDYVDDIKNAVCDTALITRGDFDSDDLSRYIVKTRSIVMYILHYKMDLTTLQCAKYVNNKSISTVYNNCKLIKEICDFPRAYNQELVRLIVSCLDATEHIVNEYIADRDKATQEAYNRREQNRRIIEEKKGKLFLERLADIKNRAFVNNTESIPLVLDVVSLFTDVSVDKIVSRSRVTEVAFARHLACYIMSEKFHIPFVKIIANVGLKNHSTITYSNLKIHDILTYPQMDIGNAITAEKTIKFFDEYLENRKVEK